MFNTFKKFSVLVGLALASVAVQVAGVQAAEFSVSTGTQQAIGQHQGIAYGSVGSESKGNAVAAAQAVGNQSSSQWANGNTLGSSTIGASLDNIGTTVRTGSMQDTKVNAGGTTMGNPQLMDGNSIVNGAVAFGSTVGNAKMDGNFEAKQYGSFHHDAAQVGYTGKF